MNYWHGMMNWPIDRNWECETCGQKPFDVAGFLLGSGLEWGLVNGRCRCTQCHTEYMMRDGDTILTRPLCQLKEEYREAAKWAWQEWEQPISELTDYKWDKALAAVSEAVLE